MFDNSEVHDEQGRVIPHQFKDGTPEYAACMDCGGARHNKWHTK